MTSVHVPPQQQQQQQQQPSRPTSPSTSRNVGALASSSPKSLSSTASLSRPPNASKPTTAANPPVDPIPLLRTSQALLALLDSEYTAAASMFPETLGTSNGKNLSEDNNDDDDDDNLDSEEIQHRRAKQVLQKLEVTKLLTNLELARPVLAHAREVALNPGSPALAPLPTTSNESHLPPSEGVSSSANVSWHGSCVSASSLDGSIDNSDVQSIAIEPAAPIPLPLATQNQTQNQNQQKHSIPWHNSLPASLQLPPPPQSPDSAAWLTDLGARTMDLRLVVRAREMEIAQREAAREEARRAAEEAAAAEAALASAAAQAAAAQAAAAKDTTAVKGSRHNGDGDNIADALFRRRKPVVASTDGNGGNQNSSLGGTLTDEDKVRLQQNVQESLAGEVLSLVATIKQNALKFSEAVHHDSAVLQDASTALEKSSGAMGAVGQRLTAYRKTGAIGWWFYIMAVVAMIVAVSAGMLIIRLFPKW